MKKYVLVALFSVLLFPTYTNSAHAIDCNGRYQVTRTHGEIATPYCEISYLARVSREFGYRYSARQLRRSFGLKRDMCDHIGDDIRIDDICAPFRSNADGDRHIR